ncbi:MAG TPA: VWA domain-containing protein [Verrucomicrobiae bacterium]|nr:VWA domain-containing protein [Verrucomicrobiae bacterium]
MARIGQWRLVPLILLATAASAQIELNPAPPRDPSVIRVDVELVDLLCSVRDKSGSYVSDLTKDDFEVYEDGKRQPVTHFARVVDSPLTVALLLDVSGSVRNVLDEERQAARQFFGSVLRPGDRGLLVGFAQYVVVWQNLTASPKLLNDALDNAGPMAPMPNGPRAHGGTLLYDAINLVADRKLKTIPDRKTMILITDGEDNGSRIGLEEAVTAAQQADTVVYGIHYQDYGASMGTGLGALEHLSGPTGGRTFHVSRKLTLAQVFAAIEEEMRNQYAVGFTPSNPNAHGVYHKVEVKMAKPGLKVQARSGYYTK